MRLLFISNFYPPLGRGGFEQWCQEVAEGLRERGHDVLVLTSRHAIRNVNLNDPAWIRRELHLEMELASLRNAVRFFTHRRQRERENLELLKQTIEQFSPDAILIWGMWNLHRSLAALAEEMMPERTAYYMGDYWPTLPSQFEEYWRTSARNLLTALPKAMLKPLALSILRREKQPALHLAHVIFPSVFMREEFIRRGVSFQKAAIIYGAIDTALYRNQKGSSSGRKEILQLVYVGRLTHEKGVHTAIEAVSLLVHERHFKKLSLTIVGDGEPAYQAFLHQLVRDRRIESFVTFMPAQPKEALPALYCQADILLFTSIWDEPFGRVIVEAMASNLIVVGAACGGAAEIMLDGENALTFPPGDAAALARQLWRLIESPELGERLRQAGSRTAYERFDIERMRTEIEAYLQLLVGQAVTVP